MVRIGALDMLEGMPVAQRWPLASPLLTDAVQGVRIRAASLLAGVPTAQLNANDRQRFGPRAERVREQPRDRFLDDPENRDAGLVAGYEHGEWGWLEQTGAPWWFDDLSTRIERPPPLLGEHTAEVLTEVGCSVEEVAALLAAGAWRTALRRPARASRLGRGRCGWLRRRWLGWATPVRSPTMRR